jgi:exonuclease III
LNTDSAGFNNIFSPRYEMWHNSTCSKRGVGILISKSLQYTVNEEIRDPKNNILALNITICGTEIILISVYGPNSNDYDFFKDFKSICRKSPNIPKICAGDWNTTYSTDPGENNIDIINMLSPPSIVRSGWLSDICDEYGLCDPFRATHYTCRDYTFVPRTGARNRSRIDFFLVSDSLLFLCNKCFISPSLSTDLFDHKSIELHFNINTRPKVHFINPSIFYHSRFQAVVATASAETYLQHAVRDQADVDVEAGLDHVGRLITKLLQCNDIEFNMALNGESVIERRALQDCEEELYLLVNTLPDPERLSDIVLSCTPDIFLDVLMGNIRNSLISFQAWCSKIKSARTRLITNDLNVLKKNYTVNFLAIQELERQLTNLRDVELSAKLNEIKIFDHLHNEKPSPLFLTLLRKGVDDSLHCILDDNGEQFLTEQAREDHIIKFFSEIYEKKGRKNQLTTIVALKTS